MVHRFWHIPIRLVYSLLASLLLIGATLAQAGAATSCANTPNTSLGTISQTVNVTNAGTYYVWSHILAPDTTNNSFYLQVNGGCAIDVGDSSSIPANAFTWVNYQNGAASSPISVNLTAGANQIVMTGREPGVGIDRLLFLGDQTCTPTGTGSNCTPAADTTPPTVSMTAPTNSSTVSGTIMLKANATDNVAVKNVQFEADNTLLGSPVTTPSSGSYSYNLNTTSLSNGTHSITAVATDTSNNAATASAVSVKVNNSTGTLTPNTPTNLTAPTVASMQVVLKWTAPTGNDAAAKYNIYRNGSVSPLATVNAPTTTYTDSGVSPSTPYSYTVTAVDSAGTESARSTAVNVTTLAGSSGGGGTTMTVKNLSFNATTKTLSWSAYTGASSYVIAQIHNPTTTRNTDYSWPHVTSTSCTIPTGCNISVTPSSGETVHYGIIPLGSNNNPVSGATWAPEITVTWPTATGGQGPTKPTNLTATPVSSSQINLGWTASTESGSSISYKVYRSSGSAAPGLIGTANTADYGDTKLAASTTYNYYVVAVDGTGKQSAQSNTIGTTTKAASTSTTATLEGVIIDGKTRQPLSRAWIYTSSQATTHGAVGAYTNDQGQYMLSGLDTTHRHGYYYGANDHQSQAFYLQFPAGINTKNVSLTQD